MPVSSTSIPRPIASAASLVRRLSEKLGRTIGWLLPRTQERHLATLSFSRKETIVETLDAAFLSGFVERRFNAWPGGTSAIPCRYARGQAAKGEFKTMKVDLLHAEAAGDLSAGVSGKHHVVVTSDMIEELEENTLRGHGTIARRGELIATTCGVVERTNKLICVRPVVQSRYVSPLVAWALSLI
jgi:hypothetical protein